MRSTYGGGGGEAELLGNLLALVVGGVALLVILGILVFVAYKLSEGIQALPFEHQQLPAWAPWLLLVPCVNIFANFWIFTQIPKSYEGYFASRGDAGDSSFFAIGLIYSILAVLSAIPYVGACFGLVNLALLIVFMVKLSTLKQRIYEPTMPGMPQTF